jgi:protein SCO1/2
VKSKALLLGLAAALLLSGCGSQTASTSTASKEPTGASVGGGTFLKSTIPADVLALPLFDANGKSFTLGSLAGQYIVIANFLTSCQEICPMTTANMRDIGNAVAASNLKGKVAVIEISVDANRDKAPRLRAYQNLFNDNTFSLASGSEKDLVALWKYFGAPGQKMAISAKESASLPLDWQTGLRDTYDVIHPDLVLIVSPKSEWRWLDLGSPKVGSSIPAKLKSYLSEDGKKNLAAPEEPTWSAAAVYSALEQLTGVKLS